MNIDSKIPNIEDLLIYKDHLFNVRQNTEYNKLILKFYKKLLFNSRYVSNVTYRKQAKEYEKFDKESIVWRGQYEKVLTLENKIANMSTCNDLWLLKVYDSHLIKVLEKTNLCKDRFCNNCKKVKQALRMQKFIPEIQKYKSNDLYHLVLTVPNVEGKELRKMVDIMNKSFARLIEYFKGKEKISGIDFKKFNYMGAIRSLEVTFNKNGYHPHLHVLLSLDYEDTKKENVNSFSRRFGQITRKFSETEILLQKVWKLLILQETINYPFYKEIKELENDDFISLREKTNKIAKLEVERKKLIRKNRITEKTISELDLGYSVIMDKFAEDHYFELFKYMTKSTKDDTELFTYQNFIDLYFQLKSVRQIQGYGCFFRLKDIDYTEEVDLRFDTLISILDNYESPRVSTEKTEELYYDTEYDLISKSNLYSYLRKIDEKEKEGCEPSLKNVK